MSWLSCKCVFNGLEYNPNGEPIGIKFWSSWNAEIKYISTDRAQRADAKNETICLVIMFTSKVIVIKMSKMSHFCFFCWLHQTISHSLDNILNCKNLYEFSETGMGGKLLSYHLWDNESRNIKRTASQQKIPKSCIFRVDIMLRTE